MPSAIVLLVSTWMSNHPQSKYLIFPIFTFLSFSFLHHSLFLILFISPLVTRPTNQSVRENKTQPSSGFMQISCCGERTPWLRRLVSHQDRSNWTSRVWHTITRIHYGAWYTDAPGGVGADPSWGPKPVLTAGPTRVRGMLKPLSNSFEDHPWKVKYDTEMILRTESFFLFLNSGREMYECN